MTPQARWASSNHRGCETKAHEERPTTSALSRPEGGIGVAPVWAWKQWSAVARERLLGYRSAVTVLSQMRLGGWKTTAR